MLRHSNSRHQRVNIMFIHNIFHNNNPIFISRLSIDVIVLTPSTINYIHMSMAMYMHQLINNKNQFTK